MTMVTTLQGMFSKAWGVILEQGARILPKFLVGLVIIVVGLLIARVIRGLAARFFLAIRIDRISDRLGISAFLARGDVRHTVAEVLATAIYWLVLVFCLEIMALALELEGMAGFFGQILAYLPKVLIAVAIVLAGIAIGAFLGSAVKLAGASAGLRAAGAAGSLMKYLVSFFALVMALEELQIATPLLVSTVQILTAAFGLTLALAFGLGCRDLAGDAVRKWLTQGSQGVPADPGALDSFRDVRE
jgi:hypothetical protein